ncbi:MULTISPECIES: histidine phosphatase family protein [Bacillaceae]|uniref:Phosphatase n=3 Tax=Bacillus TaxID=1386 RepID=U5LDT0_9BACI|nr:MULTISPECIES: histidine phosphatase family protein [Bacillus]OXT18200.1 histidine phosphatase family protein [Bacillus sp. OG2]AGX04722.1 phosphatase [Bacillus infantis NRRL B-14911]EAR68201.1 YhfR [Bacillus sp. NRRL B-14911]MCK6205632.1 histidine phosphatase family protein [Bacillus infantis]MCP1158811.1 histidine phosphatase family protein [Bacillus infantis]
MTEICLVRHGQTDWNAEGRIQGRTDIELNEMGVRQAAACRDHLANENWDIIISSPLQRARQTAEIINQNIQKPLVLMEEFIERSFGRAEGLTAVERHALFPDRDYPEMESKEDHHTRLSEGLDKISMLYSGKRVILVSHGASINALLSLLSSGVIGSGRTKLENACICSLKFNEKGWLVEYYNESGHLKAL